jgi:hypothetical protein
LSSVFFKNILENKNIFIDVCKVILYYNIKGGDLMDISTKIKLAAKYAGISESELARRLGVSPQAFGQRLKTGKFSSADLERIGEALGATIAVNINFPDGTII